MEQEEKLYDEVETVLEFTYLGDRVSAGGGCEVDVTARTRCGCVMFLECGELLCGWRFPLRLKSAVYGVMFMVNSVHWDGHVLRREDGHILGRTLDFEVEGKRKKGRPKMTWREQVEEESVMIDLRREDALCRSKWSVGVSQITDGLR